MKRNSLVLFSIGVILAIIFTAFAAPIMSPHDPTRLFTESILAAPSSKFILGTDWIGRDILSMIIWGARATLIVGIVSIAISTAIGVSVGAISGYYGGIMDHTLMRIAEMIYLIPPLFFIIIMTSIFSVKGLEVQILNIGILGWPSLARVVRSEILSMKERAYVEASRAMGEKGILILFKDVLPNVVSPITVISTMRIGQAILIEASISFLGLSDPNIITWGRMSSEGYPLLRTAWWVSTIPGFMIFITVLAFNLLGDGLRDALDVRI